MAGPFAALLSLLRAVQWQLHPHSRKSGHLSGRRSPPGRHDAAVCAQQHHEGEAAAAGAGFGQDAGLGAAE